MFLINCYVLAKNNSCHVSQAYIFVGHALEECCLMMQIRTSYEFTGGKFKFHVQLTVALIDIHIRLANFISNPYFEVLTCKFCHGNYLNSKSSKDEKHTMHLCQNIY